MTKTKEQVKREKEIGDLNNYLWEKHCGELFDEAEKEVLRKKKGRFIKFFRDWTLEIKLLQRKFFEERFKLK